MLCRGKSEPGPESKGSPDCVRMKGTKKLHLAKDAGTKGRSLWGEIKI